MTRGRTNPLGVPVRAPSEGDQSRRTRMATLQAFQAVAAPIVARVDGLESRLDSLGTQLTEHTRWVRDNELAKANQRAEDHQRVVSQEMRIVSLERHHGEVKADTKERAKVLDGRRWTLWQMLLAPIITAIGGVIAGKLL